MKLTPQEFAVRWFEEIWNQGRLDRVDELVQPDVQSFGFPQADSVLNREQFKEQAQEFRRTFSDIHITVEETVAEDNRVAVRWTSLLRHTGAGFGFAPTGKTVTVVGMSMLHLKDGRIARAWNALDMSAVVTYLSAVSARPETTY